MMRKQILLSLLLCATMTGRAQEALPLHEAQASAGQGRGALSMADLFRAMPDTLLPYLSKNNRLDMIDFMEARMKAEVTNQLEGTSEMLALTADSLALRMNDVLTVEMRLLLLPEPADSSSHGVQLKRVYRLNENQAETIVDVYSSAWRLLRGGVVERSSLLERDERLSQPVQR